MTVGYFGTGATLGVYIDFNAGVTDTPAAWTDVTADVVIDSPLTINRGRSSERDTFQTGTLGLTLLNSARKYDPEYSAGTYFGKLLPGRPIKVELTYSASTSVLFRGFIQGWPQSWETSDNKSVVSIVAHDAFKYLALAQLPESYYYANVVQDAVSAAGWAWWRLGEADDELAAADSSGNTYHIPYATGSAGINSTTTSGLVTYSANAARQCTLANYPIATTSNLYCIGLKFTVEAWVTFPAGMTAFDTHYIYSQGNVNSDTNHIRFYIQPNSTETFITAIVTKTNSTDQAVKAYSIPASMLGSRHHVAFVRDGSALTLYVDGQIVSSSGFSTLNAVATSFGFPGTIGGLGGTVTSGDLAGTTYDDVAIYLDALSTARILAHYEAGSTAGAGDTVNTRIAEVLSHSGITWLSTSLDTSQVTLRGADYSIGGSVLGYLQALERTEQGRIFIAADGTLTLHGRYHDQTTSVVAAFTDVAGGSLPYVECDHEYDDTRVVNDVVASRTNGTSQRSTDATSRTAYGLRSATVDGLQSQSDGECLDIATATVARYKDPAARIRALVVKPRANAAGLFPVVRTLDVGSKVTVRRLPLGVGSAFTKTLTIEGVTHSIGVDGEWVTTYLTAPVNPSNFLILDDATYGQLDQELVGY